MKSWLIILVCLGLSWQYMDISSPYRLDGVLMPLIFAVSLIVLIFKISTLLQRGGRNYYGGDGGGGTIDFLGGGDSDGGCGD